MKKLLILLIPFVVAGLLFLGFQYISSSKYQASALQVTATPQAEVFLDNTSLGKTPLYNDKVKPGQHSLKLVPIDVAGLLPFEEKITLTDSVLTVVDRIFKTTEAESEVSIISLEKASQEKAVEAAITSSPVGAELKLDEQPQGITPLLLKDLSISDHQITLEKEGYTSKTLRIRPTQGYRLTISAKLSIARVASESANPTPQANATPTPTLEKGKTVRILETPTGFLRVRESASVSSAEIARVNPDDTFPLLDQQEGWAKIKLENGKEGWVSTQYAKIE